MTVVSDYLIAQLSDDLPRARDALLSQLAPLLAQRLPARPQVTPETMNIVGGGIQQLLLYTRPAWQGNVRIVVGRDDLITIDVIEPDGRLAEIWRSDTPMVVSAPRAQEEVASGTADR
jgi:hypothetical protein